MARKVLRQFSASKPVSSWQGKKGAPCACALAPTHSGKPCPKAVPTVIALCQQFCPGWCHLMFAALGAAQPLLHTLLQDGILHSSSGATGHGSHHSHGSRSHQPHPSPFWTLWSAFQKDVPSQLWQKGSSCESQGEQEELLSHWSCFLSYSEHTQEVLVGWSIIQAAKCSAGEISSWGHCSVPQEQGPSARSSGAPYSLPIPVLLIVLKKELIFNQEIKLSSIFLL